MFVQVGRVEVLYALEGLVIVREAAPAVRRSLTCAFRGFKKGLSG